jgi:hypothetical protein
VIEVIKVTDTENEIEWKEFLRNQYNLFFDHRFYSYNNVFGKGIDFHPLKFRDTETGKIIAIMLGCERNENDKKIFVSCDGVSFAGFLWKKRSDLLNFLNVIAGFKKYLSDNDFDECVIRNPPFLYNKAPNQETEYALLQSGFSVTSFSISNIIDLEEFEFKKISETKKRSIKKSQKDISVEIIGHELTRENFEAYYSILRDNRELKNVSPTHSFEELIYLKNKLPESIILFDAHIRGELAAICVLFLIDKDIILNFYLAGSEKFKPEGAAEYILYKTIDWSKEHGYKYYDIGTSDTKEGLIEGLFAFKKKFLAHGFLRKTYELKLK